MVADGVSASPLSEEGAEIAIHSCQEFFSAFHFSPYLDEEEIRHILYDAFNYALRKIQERNREGEHIPYARYTTLHLLLYGRKIGLHWGQAGDGAVYLFDREDHWMRIGDPMKHVGEENSPVALQDGPESWRFGSLDPGELDAILLTTDGLADALDGTGSRMKSSIDWRKRVVVALNLAYLVNEVHTMGQAIGDMNPKNFGVNMNTGFVCAFDTDSFHICNRQTKTWYPCIVLDEHYIAPELQERLQQGARVDSFRPEDSRTK